MHKLKILQLCPRLPYPLTDGGAIGIFNITKALSDLGHDITLLTFPHSEKDLTIKSVDVLSSYAKVKLVSRALPSRAVTLAKTLLTGGAYPIERRMMKEMFDLIDSTISNQHFDIVHIDHSHMGKYGVYIKEKYSLPILLRQHNFESLIYDRFAQIEKNPVKSFLARLHSQRLLKEEVRFLQRLDGIAAISQEDLGLMKVYVPNANYRIISAGVDTDYFKPAPQKNDEQVITWIGSLEWEANLDAVQYFLKQILPLIHEVEPSVTTRIIGKASHKLNGMVNSLPIEVLGTVPDVRDFLSNSTVLIIPLRIGGGMRLKMLEFFAAGKAVVTTSIGAEGNSAIDGIHCLIRDTSTSFAEGVIELLRNSSLREELGHNARTLVKGSYTWPAIAAQFAMFYQDLIHL